MIQLDRIKKQLETHPHIEIVSLDVFDTLLDRLIPSARVSQLAAEHFAARLPCATDPGEILRSRMQYQRTNESAEKEWTVADWLDEWADNNGHDPALVLPAGRLIQLRSKPYPPSPIMALIALILRRITWTSTRVSIEQPESVKLQLRRQK